jgi:hypothetical protein
MMIDPAAFNGSSLIQESPGPSRIIVILDPRRLLATASLSLSGTLHPSAPQCSNRGSWSRSFVTVGV